MAEPMMTGGAQQPSPVRNFFGGLVDRVLPGQNYNSSTGQYSNVGTGLVGLGVRGLAGFYGGPAAGAVAGRVINRFLTSRQAGQGGVPTFGLQNGGYSPQAPMQYQMPNLQRGNLGMPGGYQPQQPGLAPGPQFQMQTEANRYPMLRQINTGGSSMPGSTQGVRDRGQGYTGEAARGIFQGLSDASRFNTGFDYSGMQRGS